MTNKEKLLEELRDAIFPSDEDEDTIEAVDMGYEEFMRKLGELASL